VAFRHVPRPGYPSPEGGGWPPQAAGWGDPSVKTASIDSKTPLRFRSTSLFQNRRTRKPSDESFASHIPNVMLIEIMLTAINLDGEMMFHADKIHDVTFARRLTPEVKSALAP
jgi:hypothetical protein